MEAEPQQSHSWKLNVQAKANKLNFKLVASNSKYFPFSLKFNYCTFFIHIESQPFTSPKPKSLKSKLHRFLQRLRPRSNNNRVTSSKTKNKATISQSSVVLGNLALFIQSIYQGDKDGIFILGSIVMICFAYLVRKVMARKAWTLLVIVIGGLVFCSNGMHLRFRSHNLYGFFWRAFKNAAYSAGLYILSQVLTAISRLM